MATAEILTLRLISAAASLRRHLRQPNPTDLHSLTVNPMYAGTRCEPSRKLRGRSRRPLRYQQLADNGTGTLSPVGGATGTNFVVDTTPLTPGNYEYAVLVTNSFGALPPARS